MMMIIHLIKYKHQQQYLKELVCSQRELKLCQNVKLSKGQMQVI